MQRTIETLLAADVAAAGTITVSYPTGFNENHFAPTGHKIAIKNGGELLQGRDFSIAFGPTSAVVTLATGAATIPAGSTVFVELHLKGERNHLDVTTIGAAGNRISRREVIEVNFGAPVVADVDGIAAVQLVGAAGPMTLVSTTVTLDVPRNVTLTGATTDHGAVTATVTGTDEYGVAVVEEIECPNDNTTSGKKAFKTVTSVVVDGEIATNGISVGFGDVLGFPVFVPNSADILYDKEDGAAVTDGTYVAGVLTKPSATTGDVRGTYDPNSACNGAKNFSVVLLLDNPTYKGATQYAG